MAEVFDRVAMLDNFPLIDDQRHIEGPAVAVDIDTHVDYNYADRNAYETQWAEETVVMERLADVLKQGEKFINMVYTYRSCSKALPQVKTADQANKTEIYEGSYAVLEPEVKKLKDFMYFQRDAIKLFCDQIKKLTVIKKQKDKEKEKMIISESLVWYLIRLLDLFALLDALKNMKACLNNDFSFYRRALGILRGRSVGADDQTQENNTLYLFLANQNSITTNLKTDLQNVEMYDDIFAVVVNQCADYLEAERYMLPIEKHCLLRVMPYCLFLMDNEKDEKKNIFKRKDLALNRVAKLFKRNPVVPLYGDMQITLEALIKRSPHFDEKVWGTSSVSEDAKVAFEYEIVNILDQTRAAHNDFIARFANTINEIKAAQRTAKVLKDALTLAECQEITATVLRGLQLLADWSAKVLQQSAWKFARPNNDSSIESQVEYERVVKFNYKSEERYALVEFIAMIKGLAALFLRNDSLLAPIIRRTIHDDLQEFVQVTLRELIRAMSKSARNARKNQIRSELLQLRTIAADWAGGIEPVDPALYGKKAEKDEKVQIPSRTTGPSHTQLVLIRNLVFGLIDKGEDKDWTSGQLKDLQVFYNKSFFYKYLLNITETVTASTDLADLWYREFYLELSKRLQFPIEMSLPWILTDHILESHNPAMFDFVLYPLDLYNDAANRALRSLKQRFLYDEVEAEVNLCFDQLLFKISEQIYAHFKVHASSLLLDKPYKAQLEIVYAPGRFHVPKSRFDVIMREKHIQLLGRSVDLNQLISQRMNTYLRQNIDYAINRFEASDLTSIIELDQQLMALRLVHRLLSKYFVLDPFDTTLAEVNESTSLVSFHSRIVLHIIFELMYDFAPNFNYNSITKRFIRAPVTFTEPVPRDAMPKSNPTFLFGNKALNGAYANSAELLKKFIGMPHIFSMLRLISKAGLPLVIGEVLRNLELKFSNVLSPYVRELMSGMPASSKHPIYDYGSEGGYGSYQLKLQAIATYPDLKSEVFQNFREVGNSIVLMNLFDLASTQLDSARFIQAAPFLGVVPEDFALGSDQANGDLSASSPLYANLQRLAATLEDKPDLARSPAILRDIVTNAWRADKYYRPSYPHVSMFKSVLQRINHMLAPVRDEWMGTDTGYIPIDSTTEFYRLWSALQFVVCTPPDEVAPPAPGAPPVAPVPAEPSVHELFGDGLFWAGSTIIHFLGQQQRFETFDFCYYILNVDEAAAAPSAKPQMREFFKMVTLVRDTNQTIFAMLNTYAPISPAPVTPLHPPATDQELTFVTIREGARAAPTSSASSSSFSAAPAFDIPPPPPPSSDQDDWGAPPPPPPPDFDDMPPPPPPPM
eukprot:TRINITY_DN1060_c0_g1_i3.p1 TRINITY_DN1060_c0_g1~~TRINITY_DN1060_c0_g1_i3.p1  ORF type:complete len:1328 (-),score=521.15 TRINITY_DN1060_c0_g1_i3:101-4084(-)